MVHQTASLRINRLAEGRFRGVKVYRGELSN